jgi:hypothetical protein
MASSDNIFNAKTSTGAGSAVKWAGGEGFLGLRGAMGGSTFTLEYCVEESVTDADWTVLDDSTKLTAVGSYQFNLPSGYVRGRLTGGSGINVNAFVRQI